MFEKDYVTGARAKIFMNVGSNMSDRYQRFPYEDENDTEIPTMYSQELNGIMWKPWKLLYMCMNCGLSN